MLSVNKIIGIEIYEPDIYDEHGLFYRNTGLRRINLPEGNYIISGQYKIIPKINYNIPPMPRREKIYAVPKLKNITIEFVENLSNNGKPIKGRIDISRNLMQLDSKLRHATSIEYLCVVFHELGHYKYYSEDKCDTYAIISLLKLGYNPSQFKAFLNILRNVPRLNNIIETAKRADNEKPARNNYHSIGSLFRFR